MLTDGWEGVCDKSYMIVILSYKTEFVIVHPFTRSNLTEDESVGYLLLYMILDTCSDDV